MVVRQKEKNRALQSMLLNYQNRHKLLLNYLISFLLKIHLNFECIIIVTLLTVLTVMTADLSFK